MKFLNIAVLGAAVALASAPAVAQFGSSSYQFIDAVKKADGASATALLEKSPGIVNTRDEKGDTALIMTIRRGDLDWAGYLLNKGADPNLAGAGGDTPLIAAARVGLDDVADWLLSTGAKVDGANRMGETPLIIAVQRRNAALVKRLLQAGADPDRTDAAAGYSARDYAKRDSRSRDIQKLIESRPPPAKAKAN